MAVGVDTYGDPFHFVEKDEVFRWLCGLLSDVKGCVRFPDDNERGVHYGCMCRPNDSEAEWADAEGVRHPWAGCDTEILNFVCEAVHDAIEAHQKTWVYEDGDFPNSVR
jgi:hypothetical protein